MCIALDCSHEGRRSRYPITRPHGRQRSAGTEGERRRLVGVLKKSIPPWIRWPISASLGLLGRTRYQRGKVIRENSISSPVSISIPVSWCKVVRTTRSASHRLVAGLFMILNIYSYSSSRRKPFPSSPTWRAAF